MACLASLSAYSSMVTLLLIFCVPILLNEGVVFVGLFFGFFIVDVVVVVYLFAGIDVGLLRGVAVLTIISSALSALV